MFYKGSRYESVEENVHIDSRGQEVRYKRLRIIPPTPAAREHEVADGERLDHVAHRYYRDALRLWRLCDANEVMWPEDLVSEPGRRILVPPSKG